MSPYMAITLDYSINQQTYTLSFLNIYSGLFQTLSQVAAALSECEMHRPVLPFALELQTLAQALPQLAERKVQPWELLEAA